MLILFDCHCVIHRHQHRVLKNSKNIKDIIPTLIQKFLWEVLIITEQFKKPDTTICFIWDSNKNINKRRKIFPDYKVKPPKELTPAEKTQLAEVYKVFKLIRTKILPKIGFINNFIQTGLEADDLIAKITDDYCKDEEILFVANDEDMYQLLRFYVKMYNPTKREIIDDEVFMKRYKIPPTKWAEVKAIGGCTSDNIKGIKRVGEITAIRYLKGTLPTHTKTYKSIAEAEGQAIIKKTLPAVKLPHAETKSVKILYDNLHIEDFTDVCNEYELTSFQDKRNRERWAQTMIY
jgi:5'-3' exonuclease